MLAPLTNLQSHTDGRLSDDEFSWLTYRSTGGFGRAVILTQQNQEKAALADWCGAEQEDPTIQEHVERTYQVVIAGELNCRKPAHV